MTLKVKANQPLALTYGLGNPGGYCFITFSFQPIEGNTYEATLQKIADRCVVLVTTIAPQAGGLREVVETQQRVPKDGFNERSDFCKAL